MSSAPHLVRCAGAVSDSSGIPLIQYIFMGKCVGDFIASLEQSDFVPALDMKSMHRPVDVTIPCAGRSRIAGPEYSMT